MGVFVSLKSRFHIVRKVIIAGMFGVCFTAHGAEFDARLLPPSNREIAGKVLLAAVENLGIPEGKGADVLFRTEGTKTEKELWGSIAEEFLLKQGYIVHESGNFPEFRFGIDSLYIKLDKGKGKKHPVGRFAEARVIAFFQETESSRKVFHGNGVFEDIFPASMMEHVGKNDPFVINHSTSYSVIKPVFFGLIMTGLVWLLYSYRG